jgi:hypothetical protein
MSKRVGAPPQVVRGAQKPIVSSIDEFGRNNGDDPAFDVTEIRFVARRQLTGSIVVALGIAMVATLTALRPSHPPTQASVHMFPVVQQPVLVAPEHFIASKN